MKLALSLLGILLIIIAARPSMGKTSFMMNIAESIAIPDRSGDPTAAAEGARSRLDRHQQNDIEGSVRTC